MANRDAKKIERILKDFSLGINTSGGGGTVVVDELPKIGEEHTVYELHQNIEPAYNWVAMVTQQMLNDNCVYTDNAGIILFDTYDQMMNVLNGMDIGDNYTDGYCYLRSEDRLYSFSVENSSWTFTEQEKIANYKFNMLDPNGEINVIKSYEGYDETDDKYYGTLLDNTRVVLGYDGEVTHYAFIPHQAVFDWMNNFSSSGQANIDKVTTLPTAQEAVENYLDELIANEGCLCVEIDGQLKNNLSGNKNYYWMNDPSVGAPNFYTGLKDPIVYTGELEWEDYDIKELDIIPYQKILKFEISDWIFKPEQGGEKISYWYYSNDEWINMDAGIADNFVKLENEIAENVYFGEKILGAKFEIDYQKYFTEYTTKYESSRFPSPIKNWDQTEMNYQEDHIVKIVNCVENYLNTKPIITYLQYDESGNVWAHLDIYELESGIPYTEISAAIKVATAEQAQDPSFEYPIVEFEIPEDLKELSNVVFVEIDDSSTYNCLESLIKVSK